MPATISTHACPASSTAATMTYSPCGAGGAAPVGRGIQHRLQTALRHAAECLQGLGLLTRRNPALPWRPCAVVGLAILGLERRPADHPLCWIEPLAPLGLVSRLHLVQPREVATLIRRTVGTEM